MKLNKKFSAQDLERIKEAVTQAEKKISGEIVPVFVAQSHFYKSSNYKGALIFATFVFSALIVFDRLFPLYAITEPIFLFLYTLLGGFIGTALVQFIPSFRRLLTGHQFMFSACIQRAQNAFFSEEIFNTKQRTGILIFVSFFERHVVILADKGISATVEQHVWDELVKELIEYIKKNKLTDGLIKTITNCGEILYQKGFVIEPDDINELRNDLRTL